MKEKEMNKELYTQFDNIFFEKTRLSILTILYKEELTSFNRIKKIIDGSDGAIFSHLQKLQDSNYIGQEKKIIGSKMQTFYSLTSDGKKLFKKYLKFLEEMIS
jgi:predicted transcriptional regulator